MQYARRERTFRKSMVIPVNTSVYDRCCSQSVLLWTIFDVGDDSLSYCNNGIPRPPACLGSGVEDGKQEINLEWPYRVTCASFSSSYVLIFVQKAQALTDRFLLTNDWPWHGTGRSRVHVVSCVCPAHAHTTPNIHIQ